MIIVLAKFLIKGQYSKKFTNFFTCLKDRNFSYMNCEQTFINYGIIGINTQFIASCTQSVTTELKDFYYTNIF